MIELISGQLDTKHEINLPSSSISKENTYLTDVSSITSLISVRHTGQNNSPEPSNARLPKRLIFSIFNGPGRIDGSQQISNCTGFERCRKS